jgi:N-formylglutamate amidohydrolase
MYTNALTYLVVRPRSPKRPVIVEIPHAGLELDAQAMVWSVAPLRSVPRDADLYVDQLFAAAPDLGATVLVSTMSRYVCDLNRAESDIDRLSVQGASGEGAPHGLVWRRTSDGDPALSGPLPIKEFERRRDRFYRPYHATLRDLVEDTRAEFGYAIVLCAHSMPSRGKPGTADAGRLRADVVPGTRGKTTAGSEVIGVSERLATRFGWTLRHDHPYRGGFTTGHYGRPAQGYHAIQIELSRSLYMDEGSLVPHERMEQAKSFCAEVVMALGRLELR